MPTSGVLQGQVEEIVPRLSAYIRNRAAAGFDRADFVEAMPQLSVVKRFLRYYSISRSLPLSFPP